MKKYLLNKKAEMGEFVKILLWVMFFVITLAAVYFLIKYLTSM